MIKFEVCKVDDSVASEGEVTVCGYSNGALVFYSSLTDYLKLWALRLSTLGILGLWGYFMW